MFWNGLEVGFRVYQIQKIDNNCQQYKVGWLYNCLDKEDTSTDCDLIQYIEFKEFWLFKKLLEEKGKLVSKYQFEADPTDTLWNSSSFEFIADKTPDHKNLDFYTLFESECLNSIFDTTKLEIINNDEYNNIELNYGDYGGTIFPKFYGLFKFEKSIFMAIPNPI
jgi:hypothetical protein